DAAGACRAWHTGRHPFPAGAESPPSSDLLELLSGHGVQTALIRDARAPSTAEFESNWHTCVRLPTSSLAHAMVEVVEVLGGLANQGSWLAWLELAALLPPWQSPE